MNLEENSFYLGEPITHENNISPINYSSDLGKRLSKKAREDIEAIGKNYKTSLHRARNFILD